MVERPQRSRRRHQTKNRPPDERSLLKVAEVFDAGSRTSWNRRQRRRLLSARVGRHLSRPLNRRHVTRLRPSPGLQTDAVRSMSYDIPCCYV
ncbi:Hypothetical protein SMAX5B_016129 [Scophthalmus maximus]|uniref:Uncharacterized protein n=1 Tax=Scophthalmus maximus TaxID=52904 RepID=A0A2U9BB32_SCOMX|nr:Hypothetical protein SMAX5B_016129 [Scophthalmus maximus]